MARPKFRFEWSHQQKLFIGPSLEGEADVLRSSIGTVHSDIVQNSGLVWRPPYIFIATLALAVLIGYTTSFLLISRQQYKTGTALLIATPVSAFVIIVAFSLSPKRIDRISKFMEVRHYEYQALLTQAGLDFSYVLLEGRFSLPSSERSKAFQCTKEILFSEDIQGTKSWISYRIYQEIPVRHWRHDFAP